MRLRLDFKCWFYKAQSHLYDQEQCPCSLLQAQCVGGHIHQPFSLRYFSYCSLVSAENVMILLTRCYLYVFPSVHRSFPSPAPCWWWQVSALTEPGSLECSSCYRQLFLSTVTAFLLLQCVWLLQSYRHDVYNCQPQFVNEKLSC